MVRCEFRLVCGGSRDADRFLAQFSAPAVPSVGEGINIDGEPYVVHERGWATTTPVSRDEAAVMYCYLRVCRLQSAPHAARPT